MQLCAAAVLLCAAVSCYEQLCLAASFILDLEMLVLLLVYLMLIVDAAAGSILLSSDTESVFARMSTTNYLSVKIIAIINRWTGRTAARDVTDV